MNAVGFIVSNNFLPYFSDHGEYNGYVAISPDCKFHNVHYDDINVDVHGGVTYSEPVILKENSFGSGRKIKEEYTGKKNPILGIGESVFGSIEDIGDDWWIIGFDTNHYMDTKKYWNKDRVISEVKFLMEQILK